MDVEFLEFVADEKVKNICKKAINDDAKRAKCVGFSKRFLSAESPWWIRLLRK